MNVLLDIVFNLGTLISISILSGFIEIRGVSKIKSISLGVLFAVGAMIGMLNPVQWSPGIIFDGRSILISVAAFYFGPITAIISAIPPILLRIVQGGSGAMMGVSVISASAIIGTILHYKWKIKEETTTKNLLLLGLITHIAMICLMNLLPKESILYTIQHIGPVVILFYPIATVIVGIVINFIFSSQRILQEKTEFQQRLLTIGENFSNGMIYQIIAHEDGSRNFTYISNSVESLYGCSVEDAMKDPSIIYSKVHPEDVERLKNTETNALKNFRNFKCEIRIINPDGGMRWSLITSTPRRVGNKIQWDGIEFVITDKKLAEEKVLKSLEEKEVLIKELYHRTKNTLQITKSLLVAQANKYSENEELNKVVRDTENRIQSISLVHEMLYKSNNLSKISIKTYIENLISLTITNFDINVETEVNIEDFLVLIDLAIPLGLVVNELITNSIKYAFQENGRIKLSLYRDNQDIIMKYSDNGKGLPKSFDFRNQDSLGMQLITSIIENQLDGFIDIDGLNGFNCFIRVKSTYKDKI